MPKPSSSPLSGVGVLVTRPRDQAGELVEKIEKSGGRVICFPVIEILPRDSAVVAEELSVLPTPDIAVFISPNAVTYGLSLAAGAAIAAIGPATSAAIRAAGRTIEIEPGHGYDSESLLASPALESVLGKNVLIVRGSKGRGILASTLRQRGATVNYLSVYERKLPTVSAAMRLEVESAWRNRDIDAITIMSVETLVNLASLLPKCFTQVLQNVPLVTPATRVIKEALIRYPAANCVLAAGPLAAEMVEAIIALPRNNPDLPHE